MPTPMMTTIDEFLMIPFFKDNRISQSIFKKKVRKIAPLAHRRFQDFSHHIFIDPHLLRKDRFRRLERECFPSKDQFRLHEQQNSSK